MEPVYLVCGFGRCGTSLIMQMMQAGGIQCTGTYPIFEATLPQTIDRHWWAGQAGKAVKILDLLGTPSFQLPDGHYRAIWMDRNPVEQARSQSKFNRVFGLRLYTDTRRSRRGIQQQLIADRPKAIQALQRLCGELPLILRFEDVLADPAATARTLAEWSGRPLDLADMVEQVAPRSPDCCKGFFELTLMEQPRMAL